MSMKPTCKAAPAMSPAPQESKPLARPPDALRLVLRLGVCALVAIGLNACAWLGREEVALRLPSLADYYRLCHLERDGAMRVYVLMTGAGEKEDPRNPLPMLLRGQFGTPAQVTRRFVDMIGGSRRFEVFDAQLADGNFDHDVLITGQITSAQVREDLMPNVRKAIVEVALSVRVMEMKDLADREKLSGRMLQAIAVNAQYGEKPAELTRIEPNTGWEDERNIPGLTAAFSAALDKALRLAAAQLEASIRPVAKVAQSQGGQLALIGGVQHGLRPGDKLVVFRSPEPPECYAGRATLKQVVAEVGCESVGMQSSQCSLVRTAPGMTPQSGDYAILSDESLTLRYQKP